MAPETVASQPYIASTDVTITVTLLENVKSVALLKSDIRFNIKLKFNIDNPVLLKTLPAESQRTLLSLLQVMQHHTNW